MTHTFCLFGTATKFSREPQCLNWPQNMQALICIYWEKYSYILHWYILQILSSFSYLDLWFLPKKWSYEFSYIYLLHTGPLVCWDSQPSHSFRFLRFCLFFFYFNCLYFYTPLRGYKPLLKSILPFPVEGRHLKLFLMGSPKLTSV